MSECPHCRNKPDEKDTRMHPYGGSCMHVHWDISPWRAGDCLPPFGDDSYGERSAGGEWLGAHYLSVCRTEHWVYFAIVSDAGEPPSSTASKPASARRSPPSTQSARPGVTWTAPAGS